MIKKHALQLGYLCCMRLKNVQKEKEFERRMSEMKINYPIPNHTINQVRANTKFNKVAMYNHLLIAAVYITRSTRYVAVQ